MKMTINKSGSVTISELTTTETDVILAIADTANRRCFREPEPNGEWYSNDDFILRLTDEQRQALAKVGSEIRKIYGE
jgi:hypothetical protein